MALLTKLVTFTPKQAYSGRLTIAAVRSEPHRIQREAYAVYTKHGPICRRLLLTIQSLA